jgi:hypothetical protein
MSFDFDVRAPPSEFMGGGSRDAELGERPAGCISKLIDESAIDEPAAYGFHVHLVCSSK